MTDDKRHDMPSRNRVEQIGESVDWIATRTSRVLVGIVIALFILAFFTVLALNAAHSQVDQTRATAIVSKRTADRLAAVVDEIQQQRRTNIRTNCEDQNRRHDKTIERLRDLGTQRHVPAERLAPTIRLIDALAPHQDCDRLVRQQTGANP